MKIKPERLKQLQAVLQIIVILLAFIVGLYHLHAFSVAVYHIVMAVNALAIGNYLLYKLK